MATNEATRRSRHGARPAKRKRRLGRPLGHRQRRLLVATLAVALPLALFAPLAVRAWQNDVFAWDAELSTSIHAYENRETIWNRHVDVFDAVLRSGFQLVGVLLVLTVLAVMLLRERLREVLLIGLVVGGAAVLGVFLKEIFEQPPVDPGSGGGYSFPSGHALRSIAAAGVLVVVAWPTRWRWPAALVGAIVVPLIGVAVVYHEWHWASDVLGGWAIGIAWVGCVWLALSGRSGLPNPGPYAAPGKR
jgi:membrane-associated phospholipid phosphatase